MASPLIADRPRSRPGGWVVTQDEDYVEVPGLKIIRV
jgi:hypothetical protein